MKKEEVKLLYKAGVEGVFSTVMAGVFLLAMALEFGMHFKYIVPACFCLISGLFSIDNWNKLVYTMVEEE